MEPLKIPGTLESLGAIAQYVMEAAQTAGLEKKTTYKLRLGVDEIATNIITHGYQEAGLSGDIVCQADINPEQLTITLEDRGIPYDPTQRPEPEIADIPLEDRPIGGLGVYLALEGVDEFKYERVDECNRNIFIVNRSE
jgi:serine/threonine-protein kinase RsbW